jgi:hypothetical protein
MSVNLTRNRTNRLPSVVFKDCEVIHPGALDSKSSETKMA